MSARDTGTLIAHTPNPRMLQQHAQINTQQTVCKGPSLVAVQYTTDNTCSGNSPWQLETICEN